MANVKSEKRIGSLAVGGFKTPDNGSWGFSEADKSNEKTLRGGSGTSQESTGSVAGGAFDPSKAANGYPSNK